MSSNGSTQFVRFQLLQEFWWWWILVFLTAAVCLGWSAAVLIVVMLFWRAAEIYLTWQMLRSTTHYQ